MGRRRRTSWRRRLWASSAVIALVAAGSAGAGSDVYNGPVDTGASANAPAVRSALVAADPDPPTAGPALLISDSAWLGMQFYSGIDQVQGFAHTLALASCRRRVVTSCTNFDGFVPPTLVDEVAARGDAFSTLIVATGYNDGDSRFAEEVDEIITLARSEGYERVVWLTLRSNVTYQSPGDAGFAEVFERNNSTLEQIEAAGTYPELVVADWATYARDEPTWFASDGIHLRRLGGYAAGDYISRKMAFLDEQACPQPESAGTVRADPCPDPDDRGPVIDLESIYPTDRRDPDSVFTLSFVGSSSWPNPPWWDES